MGLFQKKVSPEQQKVVDNLRKVLGDKDFKLFEKLVQEELAQPPKVAIIGKSGVGMGIGRKETPCMFARNASRLSRSRLSFRDIPE